MYIYYKPKLRNLHAYIHWVGRGTGTPKDRDEVNRREVTFVNTMGEYVT